MWLSVNCAHKWPSCQSTFQVFYMKLAFFSCTSSIDQILRESIKMAILNKSLENLTGLTKNYSMKAVRKDFTLLYNFVTWLTMIFTVQAVWTFYAKSAKFANKYNFACSISSLTSLVLGLSFERLLEVLVYTNFSDTKEKSFWRYFDTGMHIRTWREVEFFCLILQYVSVVTLVQLLYLLV